MFYSFIADATTQSTTEDFRTSFWYVTTGLIAFGPILAVMVAYQIGKVQAELTKTQTKVADTQRQTDQNRLKLELYERRYAVYDAAQRFISQITRDLAVENDLIRAYASATLHVEFLFKKDMVEFLRSLVKSVTALRANQRRLKIANASNIDKLADEEHRLTLNMIKIEEEIVDRFRPYLDFSSVH